MSLGGGFGSITFHKVIDMGETRLQTISRFQAFLAGTLEVRFCVHDNDDTPQSELFNRIGRFLMLNPRRNPE
ncbi:hypothetical protein [Polaromonas sp. JS666]|uniref:hypothetical protein n=1 Tax=Polaromonas sp. (strain JS666 / ATCC BAA-500) TaxID=296591 RepID=UPI00005371B4|nr:hypothetical protein [Polaromonas sp. JS666]ABE45824.1 hypothetical protein Bpro_3930 [Polaromonas sp. JS666]